MRSRGIRIPHGSGRRFGTVFRAAVRTGVRSRRIGPARLPGLAECRSSLVAVGSARTGIRKVRRIGPVTRRCANNRYLWPVRNEPDEKRILYMKTKMLRWIAPAVLSLALVACSDDDAPSDPAGTVTLNMEARAFISTRPTIFTATGRSGSPTSVRYAGLARSAVPRRAG